MPHETAHSDDFAAFQLRRAEAREAAKTKARSPRRHKPAEPVKPAPVTADKEALEAAQLAARAAKGRVADLKLRFAAGHATYDELATAGKAYSEALYHYAKLKSPALARHIPYHDVIR